ncbi:helix-turn-helix transcriptional regulator [Vogesella facilis]|uniref:Helix-turn-helix transcriptional regulator n=1 Tax=Vogesella facilis TaxID=1655232 RepID=A0ABV7RAP6_9NEIS
MLQWLKTAGAQTVQQLAAHSGLSGMGVRKQLQQLQVQGLVACESRREGVGRPAQYWLLTAAGHAVFPDRHGELSAQLLQLLGEQLGAAGLEALIAARAQQVELRYQQALTACEPGERLQQLATLRSEDGYMAQVQQQGADWLLLEHHCPICAAASACPAFCRTELQQFRRLFAGVAEVERSEHLLAGGQRCVYRISALRT